MDRPKPVLNLNVAIITACEQYLDSLETSSEHGDEEHQIFEKAMEMFYGKNIWEYVNSKSR